MLKSSTKLNLVPRSSPPLHTKEKCHCAEHTVVTFTSAKFSLNPMKLSQFQEDLLNCRDCGICYAKPLCYSLLRKRKDCTVLVYSIRPEPTTSIQHSRNGTNKKHIQGPCNKLPTQKKTQVRWRGWAEPMDHIMFCQTLDSNLCKKSNFYIQCHPSIGPQA